MAKDKLKEFYLDDAMKEAVATFMADALQKIALERVFNKQDVSALPDAREILNRMFIELRNLYDTEPKREVENRAE